MPEDKKDSKQKFSMQQKRLQRFYYDESDIEEIFNIQVKESTKKSEKNEKKSLLSDKKSNN